MTYWKKSLHTRFLSYFSLHFFFVELIRTAWLTSQKLMNIHVFELLFHTYTTITEYSFVLLGVIHILYVMYICKESLLRTIGYHCFYVRCSSHLKTRSNGLSTVMWWIWLDAKQFVSIYESTKNVLHTIQMMNK